MNLILIVCDSVRYDVFQNMLLVNSFFENHNGVEFLNAWSGGSTTELSAPYLIGNSVKSVLDAKNYESLVLHSNVVFNILKLSMTQEDIVKKKTGFFERLYRKILKLPNNPYTSAIYMGVYILHKINVLKEPFFLCSWFMDAHTPYVPMSANYFQRNRAIKLTKKLYESFKADRKILFENNRSDEEQFKKTEERTSQIYKDSWTKDEINELKSFYKMKVRDLDRHLSLILNELDIQKNMVILTSDHGEEFMEGGHLGHRGYKDIPELRHVPLLMVYDGFSLKYKIESKFDMSRFYQLLDSMTEKTPETELMKYI